MTIHDQIEWLEDFKSAIQAEWQFSVTTDDLDSLIATLEDARTVAEKLRSVEVLVMELIGEGDNCMICGKAMDTSDWPDESGSEVCEQCQKL